MEKIMKAGAFLTRIQPLHNGHLGMIDKALSENDKVVILIGSTNKCGTLRNPLEIGLRRQILFEALDERYKKEDRERLIVKELPDWSMENDLPSNPEWGRYLYYNIVSALEQQHFAMYFSDDRAIIEDWLRDESIKHRIELKIFDREKMFNAVSSTKIRQAFLSGDKEYICKSTPNAVYRRFDEIKNIICNIEKSPREDYKMEA